MTSYRREKVNWMDLLWLLFLGGLAVLPPVREVHKQLILLAIGALQLFEGSLIQWAPHRGKYYAVLLKILLSMLLLAHTGGLEINSSYYPIFYVPIVTAAVYFGPLGTMLWTLLASAAYCSYLYPALQQYQLAEGGYAELAHPHLVFLSGGHGRQPLRHGKSPPDIALPNLGRAIGRNQSPPRTSPSPGAPVRTLAALGQLSAGLAHEIRNPLGIIKGSAEMLIERLKSAEPLAAELAGYISTEVNRLSALVTRFLDFARPLRLELKPESLPAIVDLALKAVAANWSGPADKGRARSTSPIFRPSPSMNIFASRASSIWLKMPMRP